MPRTPGATTLLGRALHGDRSCGRRWRSPSYSCETLQHALIQHAISHFYKPGDIRSHDKIARMAVLRRCVPRHLMARGHDVAPSGIDFLARPGQPTTTFTL